MDSIVIPLPQPVDLEKLHEIEPEATERAEALCHGLLPFLEGGSAEIESTFSDTVAVFYLSYEGEISDLDIEEIEEIAESEEDSFASEFSVEVWLMVNTNNSEICMEYWIEDFGANYLSGHKMPDDNYGAVFELFNFLMVESGTADLIKSKSEPLGVQVVSREKAAELLQDMPLGIKRPTLYASRSYYNDIVFSFEALECLTSFCDIYIEEERNSMEHYVDTSSLPEDGDIIFAGMDGELVELEYKPKAGMSNITHHQIFKLVAEHNAQEVVYLSIEGWKKFARYENFLRQFMKEGDVPKAIKQQMAKQREHQTKLEQANEELFDELRKQAEVITGLKKENEKLRQELNHYKSNDNDNSPILFQGTEKELFTGETKEIVLAVLSSAVNGLSEGSRRKDVIADVLAANEYQKILSSRKEQLKLLLKDYKSMSPELESKLADLGIMIKRDGKHYVLSYYDDPRYTSVIAKTSSDFRSGANNISKIARDFL